MAQFSGSSRTRTGYVGFRNTQHLRRLLELCGRRCVLFDEVFDPIIVVAGLVEDGERPRAIRFLPFHCGIRSTESALRDLNLAAEVAVIEADEDLPGLLLEVAEGRLRSRALKLKPGCAITVVLAAENYPEGAKKGVPIALGETADADLGLAEEVAEAGAAA